MIDIKYKRYAMKCKAFSIRYRKGKDDKYIEFLEKCPNKAEFFRKAIDRELST